MVRLDRVNLRRILAILLAGIALGGAVFLASVHLKMHGHYHCAQEPGHPQLCLLARSYWVVGRYGWQIPVAVVVGVVGLLGAIAVANPHLSRSRS